MPARRAAAHAAIVSALSVAVLVLVLAALAQQTSAGAAARAAGAVLSAGAGPEELGIDDPSGVRLSISASEARDPAGRTAQLEPARGHWILLSVTVTNLGMQVFALRPTDFQIRTDDGMVYWAVDGTNISAQALHPVSIGVGQTVQGDAVFDLPAGKAPQAAMFQANGTNQFVIAALTP